MLPQQTGITSWILFSVGVGAAVSAHHVSVSSVLWSLGGGALLSSHTASPARPFSNPSDRSDTSGVCKDWGNRAFQKLQQHTGWQPLRSRGSRDTQVIDFLNYPGVRSGQAVWPCALWEETWPFQTFLTNKTKYNSSSAIWILNGRSSKLGRNV